MTIFRKVDAAISLSVSLMPAVVQLLFGDPLYVGVWYYLVVPTAAVAIGVVARAKPMFLVGTSLAIFVTLLIYAAINLSLARPEGLLALGHLISLPGAAIGTLIGALLSRRLINKTSAMALGFAGALVGFFINQLFVCDWLVSCGAISSLFS